MVMSTNQQGEYRAILKTVSILFPRMLVNFCPLSLLISWIHAFSRPDNNTNIIHTLAHTSECFFWHFYIAMFYTCVSIHGSQTCALQDCRSDKIILLHMGGEETIWGTWGGGFVVFLAFFDVSDALYCLPMAAKTTSVLLVFEFHY